MAQQHDFAVGTEVDLYHQQWQVWQPGFVFRNNFELGVSWPQAQRWNKDWADVYTDSVTVSTDREGSQLLRWDDKVSGPSLPRFMWGRSPASHTVRAVHG
jgi:hypothetical protein